MLRRVIRILLRAVLALIALAVVLAAFVVFVIWPPRPLLVPAQGVEIADLTIVNPGLDRRPGVNLAIHGDRIAKIKDYVAGKDQGHENLRFAGGYVLPGLIDLHVHHPPALSGDIPLFELMYLAHGVTAVRDTGNFDGSILQTRQRIAEGKFPGPRIFACGPIFDGDPPFWPHSRIVHNAAEANRAVDEVAATGVDCIKTYNFLTPDALAGLREGATRNHLPLIGHVPLAVPIENSHIDEVQHLTGVPAIPPQPASARESLGDALASLIEGWDKLDEARIDFIVRTSLDRKIAHTPTLVVIQQIGKLADYPVLLDSPDAQILPRYWRALIWAPGGLLNSQSVTSETFRKIGAIVPKMRLVVRRMHDAGVPIHVGTDVTNPFVVPGASLPVEMRNLVDSGFSTEEVWAATTRGNAQALTHLPGLGVVAEGAPADFLIFREDPSTDLSKLSTLEAVVANGRLYTIESLNEALARYKARSANSLYDFVSMTLTRLIAGHLT